LIIKSTKLLDKLDNQFNFNCFFKGQSQQKNIA